MSGRLASWTGLLLCLLMQIGLATAAAPRGAVPAPHFHPHHAAHHPCAAAREEAASPSPESRHMPCCLHVTPFDMVAWRGAEQPVPPLFRRSRYPFAPPAGSVIILSAPLLRPPDRGNAALTA